MSCLKINFILDATGPEGLSAKDKQTVELHFTSCETCRDAWGSYRAIAAQKPPRTPRNLGVRIAAAIEARAPAEARRRRRPLVLGGLLVIGAAAAAGIALQFAERAPEIATRVEEPALPAAAPALPGTPDTAPNTA